MKKIYTAPAYVAVELEMKSNAMLSAVSTQGETIIPGDGEGDGADIAVKGPSGGNIWDNEW